MVYGTEYLTGESKRRLDVLGASVLIGAFAPGIALTGLVCAINARKLNPLLIQERSVGDGRVVETYKFQTLTKAIGGLATDQTLGTFDPRSSATAQVIRQLGLDETPQLANVLQGNMSLVGPRPVLESDLERFEDADPQLFKDWYASYSAFKPGITGNSQLLRHHYRETDDDLRVKSMRLDIDYFESADLSTDLKHIAQTPLRIIKANVAVEDANDFSVQKLTA